MITLSDLEKNFLKGIVEMSQATPNVFISNLIDDDLKNIDVYLNRDTDTVEFRFDHSIFENDVNLIDRVRRFSTDFMRRLKLLKYLENENYLYLYQESEPEITSRFGQLIEGNPFIASEINDSDIKKLLIDNSHRTIVVGQTLIDYVQNDFQTPEQVRHTDNMRIARKNLTVAIIAICVSILIGLCGIVLTLYLSNKQSNVEITIEKKQFESLKRDIQSIKSTMANFKISDTLKTEITNEIKIKKIKK